MLGSMGWKRSTGGRRPQRQPDSKASIGASAASKSVLPPSSSSAAQPQESTVQFPPDWNEFIELLSSNRVRYLIVGAHALAIAGRPRATQALDIFVDPTVENAARLGMALRSFGFPRLADEAALFAQSDRMATLGNPPLQIDIMNSISGLTFDEAFATRTMVRIGNQSVAVLGSAGLVANKSATGRAKDAADLDLLRESEG